MSIRPRRFAGALLAAACLCAAVANAETYSLELKRFPSAGPGMVIGPGGEAKSPNNWTHPQDISMRLRTGQTAGKTPFSKIAQKEPKYQTKNPFRGVAKLGTGEYIFAVDAVAEKPASKTPKSKVDDEKTKASAGTPKAGAEKPKAEVYNRLYFDFNRNGDLTDDKPIKAPKPIRAAVLLGSGRVIRSPVSDFPRVDLEIDVYGKKVDYAFLFDVTSWGSSVSGTLSAAAYREGKLKLDGNQRHVVLLDFNSNGRFDDVIAVDEDGVNSGRIRYPTEGDLLLIGPDQKKAAVSPLSSDPAAAEYRHHVSELVNLDGRYYDMAITPAGDKLTLDHSSVPVGKVTCPVDGLNVTVYGELGVLNLWGSKSEPILLPEGQWKLLNYTINQTGGEEPKDESAEKKREKWSLLDALAGVLTEGVGFGNVASPPPFSLVSAHRTKDCKPMHVKAGETVALTFGPPWKPVVKASTTIRPGRIAELSLVIVGSGGDVCDNLEVNGDKPKQPEFTITTPDGEEVAKGKFEWG